MEYLIGAAVMFGVVVVIGFAFFVYAVLNCSIH